LHKENSKSDTTCAHLLLSWQQNHPIRSTGNEENKARATQEDSQEMGGLSCFNQIQTENDRKDSWLLSFILRQQAFPLQIYVALELSSLVAVWLLELSSLKP